MAAELKVVEISKAVNDEALSLARELLTRVESGEYAEFIVIARRRDGSTDTMFTASSDCMQLLSMAARLAHQLQGRMDRESKIL